MHKSIELSCWVERDTMCSMGFEKMVCREDEKQAAAAGLMSKPLTAPSVEKCLKDFGLDAELPGTGETGGTGAPLRW